MPQEIICRGGWWCMHQPEHAWPATQVTAPYKEGLILRSAKWNEMASN